MEEKYLKQVKLVVEVLQIVATENCFALKGGTAISSEVLINTNLIDLKYHHI